MRETTKAVQWFSFEKADCMAETGFLAGGGGYLRLLELVGRDKDTKGRGISES